MTSYPSRHTTRLRHYDYSQSGAYFVTLCIEQRLSLLGQITDAQVRLSPAGTMVAHVWSQLDQFYPVAVDAFVVMPNHLHGILVLGEAAREDRDRDGAAVPTSGIRGYCTNPYGSFSFLASRSQMCYGQPGIVSSGQREKESVRRFVLLLILIAVPGLMVAPSFAGASPAGFGARKATPVRETGRPACTTSHSTAKSPSNGSRGKKPAAGCSTAGRKQPATPKPAAKKTPQARHSSKSPGVVPGVHPSAVRTATATPKPTATSTPTPTPTPTATETQDQILTLPASSASISVRAVLPGGYGVAFMVCGLPAGVTASFTPGIALATADSASPTGASAHATLTVITPRAVPVRTYGLRIDTYFQDPNGKPTWSLPVGGQVDPPGVVLTVKDDDDTILTPVAYPPPAGFESCSAVPPSFQP